MWRSIMLRVTFKGKFRGRWYAWKPTGPPCCRMAWWAACSPSPRPAIRLLLWRPGGLWFGSLSSSSWSPSRYEWRSLSEKTLSFYNKSKIIWMKTTKLYFEDNNKCCCFKFEQHTNICVIVYTRVMSLQHISSCECPGVNKAFQPLASMTLLQQCWKNNLK